jgi:hypothetical protein
MMDVEQEKAVVSVHRPLLTIIDVQMIFATLPSGISARQGTKLLVPMPKITL